MIIMNRKGFTMIELLAALVILGLLMAVAAPNIMGVLNKNRNTTYVEDAQKLASRAEYVLRGDPKIDKPSSSTCIGFSLGYLDNSEFTNPPYGGAYYANASFVVVERVNGEYKYYVQLIENLCKKAHPGEDCQDGSRGVNYTDVESLSSGNPNAVESKYLSTSISSKRSIVDKALFVWIVDKTKCPVMADLTAI